MNHIQACIANAVSALPNQSLLLQSKNGRVRAVFLPLPRKAPTKMATLNPAPEVPSKVTTPTVAETPKANPLAELVNMLKSFTKRESVECAVRTLVLDIRDGRTLSDEKRSEMLSITERFVAERMQRRFLAEANRPLTTEDIEHIQQNARKWMDDVLSSHKPKAQPKAKSTPAPKPQEKRAPKPRGFASLESVLGYLTRPHIILHTKGGGHQVVQPAHLALTNAA